MYAERHTGWRRELFMRVAKKRRFAPTSTPFSALMRMQKGHRARDTPLSIKAGVCHQSKKRTQYRKPWMPCIRIKKAILHKNDKNVRDRSLFGIKSCRFFYIDFFCNSHRDSLFVCSLVVLFWIKMKITPISVFIA